MWYLQCEWGNTRNETSSGVNRCLSNLIAFFQVAIFCVTLGYRIDVSGVPSAAGMRDFSYFLKHSNWVRPPPANLSMCTDGTCFLLIQPQSAQLRGLMRFFHIFGCIQWLTCNVLYHFFSKWPFWNQIHVNCNYLYAYVITVSLLWKMYLNLMKVTLLRGCLQCPSNGTQENTFKFQTKSVKWAREEQK